MNPPTEEKTMEWELLEKLAEIEHNQWMKWASTLMAKENLSPERIERWKKDMVPYAELSEEVKEYDRKWARLSLALLASSQDSFRRKVEKMKDLHFIKHQSNNIPMYKGMHELVGALTCGYCSGLEAVLAKLKNIK